MISGVASSGAIWRRSLTPINTTFDLYKLGKPRNMLSPTNEICDTMRLTFRSHFTPTVLQHVVSPYKYQAPALWSTVLHKRRN